MSSLLELSNRITKYYRPGNMPSTYTSRDFQSMILRPLKPESSIPLGTTLVYDRVTDNKVPLFNEVEATVHPSLALKRGKP